MIGTLDALVAEQAKFEARADACTHDFSGRGIHNTIDTGPECIHCGVSQIPWLRRQIANLTYSPLAKMERRVLDAARRYGNAANVREYTDKQQGDLLGQAFKYAAMLRETKPRKRKRQP